MKKKFSKKLSLNKATITRLQNEEMNFLKGGTLLTMDTCECDTYSCSIFIVCCDTTINKVKNNLELDNK